MNIDPFGMAISSFIYFLIFGILFLVAFCITLIIFIKRALIQKKTADQLTKGLKLKDSHDIFNSLPFLPGRDGYYRGHKIIMRYRYWSRAQNSIFTVAELKLAKKVNYSIDIESFAMRLFQRAKNNTGNAKFDKNWDIKAYPKDKRCLINREIQDRILNLDLPIKGLPKFSIYGNHITFEIAFGTLDGRRLRKAVDLLVFIANKIESLKFK